MKTHPLLKSLSLFSLSAIPAPALSIYLDLGVSEDVGGGNWNTVSTLNRDIPDLIDWDTGLPTGISLDTTVFLSNLQDEDTGGNGGGWDHSTPGNWVTDAVAHDALGNRDRVSFQFASLSKETTYTIEILSFARDRTMDPQDITIQGLFADRDALNTGENGDDWDASTSLNGNWLIWDNVLPGGGAGPDLPGEIIILMDDEDDDDGFNAPIIINAIRISANQIPEPSSALLSIVALTSILGRRSRASR